LPDAKVDERETAVLYILRVADMLNRLGDTRVFGKEISQAQFNILMILKRHGQEGMSQKEILANLVSTKGNVSIHIRNLLKKGYVLKKTSKHDGRLHVIKLSARGRRILESVEPKYLEQLRVVVEDLPASQAETLVDLLEGLRLNCARALDGSSDGGDS